jgi:gluconolactonase
METILTVLPHRLKDTEKTAMKTRMILTTLLLTLFATIGLAQAPAQNKVLYPPGPDSQEQPGVPKGELIKFNFEESKIFPGTFREVTVYVPAQYDPAQPACLYVNQDGVQYKAPTVFDNLIHRKEMPVTIGVFVMHGRVRAANPDAALDRFNRSYEYDGVGDNYARFLIDELLPAVEKMKTADGRPIRLSKKAADRAIGGSSSGAICAFTAAWERPDSFSRVFSAIGTYVGLRGGDHYHSLVRKFEPKPIRVFLQDGANDSNSYAGDWFMANQTLYRALVFGGYEVEKVWGEGAHSSEHATAIFPDAMRWLWKGWPAAVPAGNSNNNTLKALLLPGEGWQQVSEGYRFTEGPAVNAKGEVFYNDVPNSKTYKIGLDGRVSLFLADSKRGDGQSFGPDGRLYAAAGAEQKILAWDAEGRATAVAEGFRGNDLVVASNGNIYVTFPGWNGSDPSQVILIRPNGEKKVVDTGLRFSNGITMSPDQTLLYVADTRTRWVYSYQIQSDGTLAHKQKFYWLHFSDADDDSMADGLDVDRDGRLYVATRYGVQICDQAGKVQAILPTPNGKISNISIGGENFDILYATCGDKVYRRKLNTRGAPSWEKPTKPPAPRL